MQAQVPDFKRRQKRFQKHTSDGSWPLRQMALGILHTFMEKNKVTSLSLSLEREIHSKHTKGINIIPKVKLLEDNIIKVLQGLGGGEACLSMTPIAQKIIPRTHKWEYMKLKDLQNKESW